jgi:hypothetical protein
MAKKKRGEGSARRPPAKVANKFLLRFSPETLEFVGPLVPAAWSLPAPQVELLKQAGRPIPAPFVGSLLIDTGAQRTCISLAAARTLGLKAISKVKGFGAGGEHVNDLVFARLQISIKDHRGIMTQIWWDMPCQAIPEMEKHLDGVELNGEPVVLVGLLGRDLLRLATVMYSGRNGTLEVIFDPEWIRSRHKPNEIP